jgi:hypothetical protein
MTTGKAADEFDFDGTQTVVLYDELAYEARMPVEWKALPGEPDVEVARRLDTQNLRLLQACAALDEGMPRENREDLTHIQIELERIDYKVNLLLELVGQLVGAMHTRPEMTRVRFNGMGASFVMRESQPATNSFGLLRIHLPGPLPQPLALLARVVSLEPDGVVKVRFLPLPDAVVDQIDKLAFRRHRRKVAGQHRSGR